MKKHIIILLLILITGQSKALSYLNIQGQLTNVSNGIGIPNYTIYITDNINYSDSILTGANGFYSLLITNTIYNTTYYLKTKDCNNIWHYGNAIANLNNTIIIDFSICHNIIMNCQNEFTNIKQNYNTFGFFGNNISSYPTSYHWNFGDGTIATGQNVIHTFPQNSNPVSNYLVTLITKTTYPSDTCYSDTRQNIVVIDTVPLIRGKVTANDTLFNGGWVTLFGINNPVGSCVAVDTSFIDNMGNYYFSDFTVNYPAYILKVDFPSGSAISNNYIPSYYDSLYSWMNSPPVFPVADTTTYNIQLIDFVSNQASGIGSITGSLTANGEKTAHSILENIDILLINQNNQVLKLQKANFQGYYSFVNLPMATYKVFIEFPGKIMIPANVSLTVSSPDITNLNFVISDNIISLAVNDELELQKAVSEIYPNPVKEDAFIDFSFIKAEEITVTIYNQFGQKVSQKTIYIESGFHRTALNVQDFSPGFYTVKISTKNQKISRKLIKF